MTECILKYKAHDKNPIIRKLKATKAIENENDTTTQTAETTTV